MILLFFLIIAIVLAKLIVKFCIPKNYTFTIGTPTRTTTIEYIRPEIPLEMGPAYAEAQAMKTGEPFIHIKVDTIAKGNRIKNVVKIKSFRNLRIKCGYCGTEINVDKDPGCPRCGSDYSPKEVEELKKAKIDMVCKAGEERMAEISYLLDHRDYIP